MMLTSLKQFLDRMHDKQISIVLSTGEAVEAIEAMTIFGDFILVSEIGGSVRFVPASHIVEVRLN
jgi:hypothetical protein